ncbi:MAG: haloacid dehalogenase type II, partial [Pseudomonadota bacterium]
MAHPDFADIGACVFDAYGTLFDVHSAVRRGGAALGDKADKVSALWRQKQLEYTWLRSLMGAHVDFWQVTGDGLDYALAANGISDPPLRARLMDLYLSLDAYPDVADALRRLRAGGKATAILSNGAPKMLDAAVTSAGLADLLDAALSIEDVGIYKPDRRVDQLAVERMRVTPRRICFVSTNAWD